MRAAAALTGGFADPVFQSQAVFRAVLNALARPGTVSPVPTGTQPPPPLNASAGAILLALADADTPVFLEGQSAAAPAVAEWLRFHAGAPVVGARGAASFAVIGEPGELATLADFAQGSAEYPDRSATLILQVAGFASGARLTLRGPGIRDTAMLAVDGLPQNFEAMWRANRALFPLGVDVILAAPDTVAALPRSTEIVSGDAASGSH